LVTGSGSGIGRAIAEKLGKQGERVVVNDLRGEAADEVVARIRESGGEASAAPGDVSDVEDVDRILAAAREAYGSPEILVNNAGFLRHRGQRRVAARPDWWRRAVPL
jgi:3-oxoacyl-[acyl-carrier protein] reductase